MDIINYLRNKIHPKVPSPSRIRKIRKLKKTRNTKEDANTESAEISPEVAENLEKISLIEHKEDDFICPLCLRFISCSVITPCGHAFCEVCLEEYLLYFPVCLLELSKMPSQNPA